MLVSFTFGLFVDAFTMRTRAVIASLIEVALCHFPVLSFGDRLYLVGLPKPLPFIEVSLYGTLGLFFLAYLLAFEAVA